MRVGRLFQQAPGFCEQKSWNCEESEPPVPLPVEPLGADVPPPLLVLVPLEPVEVPVLVEDVPPVPAVPVEVAGAAVEPDWVLGAVVAPDVPVVAVGVGVGVALALAPVPLERLPGSVGIGTSTGGPGTCWTVALLPPQPASASVAAIRTASAGRAARTTGLSEAARPCGGRR
jgi:hypothetical protein